jgi:hypothetical protein
MTQTPTNTAALCGAQNHFTDDPANPVVRRILQQWWEPAFFDLTDDARDNKMSWCCYCGKRLVRELIAEETTMTDPTQSRPAGARRHHRQAGAAAGNGLGLKSLTLELRGCEAVPLE